MKKLGRLVFIAIFAMLLFDYAPNDLIGQDGKDDWQMAPEFSLSQLDGGIVSLSDYRGKVVLLNFWATWCGPCKHEIPILKSIRDQYDPEKLEIIGIAIRSGGREQIQKFADKYEINYPILYGSDRKLSEIVQLYGSFTSIPSTFLIDQEGKAVSYYKGAQPGNYLRSEIDKLLSPADS